MRQVLIVVLTVLGMGAGYPGWRRANFTNWGAKPEILGVKAAL